MPLPAARGRLIIVGLGAEGQGGLGIPPPFSRVPRWVLFSIAAEFSLRRGNGFLFCLSEVRSCSVASAWPRSGRALWLLLGRGQVVVCGFCLAEVTSFSLRSAWPSSLRRRRLLQLLVVGARCLQGAVVLFRTSRVCAEIKSHFTKYAEESHTVSRTSPSARRTSLVFLSARGLDQTKGTALLEVLRREFALLRVRGQRLVLGRVYQAGTVRYTTRNTTPRRMTMNVANHAALLLMG